MNAVRKSYTLESIPLSGTCVEGTQVVTRLQLNGAQHEEEEVVSLKSAVVAAWCTSPLPLGGDHEPSPERKRLRQGDVATPRLTSGAQLSEECIDEVLEGYKSNGNSYVAQKDYASALGEYKKALKLVQRLEQGFLDESEIAFQGEIATEAQHRSKATVVDGKLQKEDVMCRRMLCEAASPLRNKTVVSLLLNSCLCMTNLATTASTTTITSSGMKHGASTRSSLLRAVRFADRALLRCTAPPPQQLATLHLKAYYRKAMPLLKLQEYVDALDTLNLGLKVFEDASKSESGNSDPLLVVAATELKKLREEVQQAQADFAAAERRSFGGKLH